MRPPIRLLIALLTTLPLVHPALAETPRGETGTNIIGTQEAPTVLNVVPWKDREVRLERKDPTTALLDRVLEPLDQDVLLREIDYHERLSVQPD
ncbi:hypothetical protein [Isoalcanivorax indicus]|uniref:hypothetical protein n=1 Tax=Isoalcanivorax indicus TaxID=2202653 RepID=UPI001FECA832|nr:hypothetical protein [Isoalcanivorax indicus]